MGTHRHRQADQHTHRFAPGLLVMEPEQRSQQVWTVRQVCGLFIDQFDLVTLQDGDICEFAGPVAAAVLDYQQTRRNHLKNQAKRG